MVGLRKVTFSILIAFIISFSVLSLSLFLYHYRLEDGKWVLQASDSMLNQENFYSQVSNVNQKKIFLIGSSQVEPLDTNIIRDDLLRNNLNFTVYNLGIGGDIPKNRVKTIDWIISAKPAIVVYGIAERDLPTYDSAASDKQIDLIQSLPLIQSWIPEEQKFQDDFFFLHAPKLDLLTFLFGNNTLQYRPFYLNPNKFARYLESQKWPVANDTTLEIQSQQSRKYLIFPLEKNVDFISLKTMIKKLHENKIDVILYITPQDRHRLEKIPYPVQFTYALKNITKEYPYLPIYSLWDRYEDMHIWKDYTHVVNNSPKFFRLYSDDIAKMILEETPSNSMNSQLNNTDYPPKFDYALDKYQRALQ